jgi:hypothetical protein
MRIRYLVLVITASAVAGLGQNREPQRVSPPPYPAQYRTSADYLRAANVGHYPGSQFDTAFANGQSMDVLATMAPRADAQSQASDAYAEYLERQRRDREALRRELMEPQAQANPDAPDQSELLKNAKDPDFILRNFRTMYVDAHAAQYFGSDQMKAALGKNKEFQKLRIHIVDDPRVADVVLKVSYTFAWDYPFELRHQNTTVVLLAGKGEGPFSGPLGAADVARKFVNAAKPWRQGKSTTESQRHGESQAGKTEEKR